MMSDEDLGDSFDQGPLPLQADRQQYLSLFACEDEGEDVVREMYVDIYRHE